MQKYPVRYDASSKTVYAAPLGAGLYKSGDGGLHWTQVYGEGLPSARTGVILDIEFTPEDGGTVYIATLNGLRKSHGSGWTADGAGIVSGRIASSPDANLRPGGPVRSEAQCTSRRPT